MDAFKAYENLLLLLTLTSSFFYGPLSHNSSRTNFIEEDGMKLEGHDEHIKIFSDFYRLSRYHIYLSSQTADSASPLAATKTFAMISLMNTCLDSDWEHIFTNMNASFDRLKALMLMIVQEKAPRLFENTDTFDPMDFPAVDIDTCMGEFKKAMRDLNEEMPRLRPDVKMSAADLRAEAGKEDITVSEQELDKLESDLAFWESRDEVVYYMLPILQSRHHMLRWAIKNKREQIREPLITQACVHLVTELNGQVKKVIEWVMSIYFSLYRNIPPEAMLSFMFQMSYSIMNQIGDTNNNFVVKNTVFEACLPSESASFRFSEDELRSKPGCETTFKPGDAKTCGEHCAYIEGHPLNEFYNCALKDDNGIRMLESHGDVCKIKGQCQGLLEKVVPITENMESGKPHDFLEEVLTLSKIPAEGKKDKKDKKGNGLFFDMMVQSFCNDAPCIVSGSEITRREHLWGMPLDRLLHLLTYYSGDLDIFSKLMRGLMMDPKASPKDHSDVARLALVKQLEEEREILREDEKWEEAGIIWARLKDLDNASGTSLDTFFTGWSDAEIILWEENYGLVHMEGGVSFEETQLIDKELEDLKATLSDVIDSKIALDKPLDALESRTENLAKDAKMFEGNAKKLKLKQLEGLATVTGAAIGAGVGTAVGVASRGSLGGAALGAAVGAGLGGVIGKNTVAVAGGASKIAEEVKEIIPDNTAEAARFYADKIVEGYKNKKGSFLPTKYKVIHKATIRKEPESSRDHIIGEYQPGMLIEVVGEKTVDGLTFFRSKTPPPEIHDWP